MTNLRGAYKKEAYEQAIAFRRRGFTYTEIAKICAVSRGTISNWLKEQDFSQSVTLVNKARAAKANTERLKLVNKARNSERKTQTAAVLHLAETEFKHYRSSPLFISGLTLYLALGDLTHSQVIRLASSRPELHQLFISFTEQYLGMKTTTLKFWLLLYPTHDPVIAMKHWSKKTGISVANFHKNQVVRSRSNKHPLHFGVGNTIIGSTLLKQKLSKWILLLQKELK